MKCRVSYDREAPRPRPDQVGPYRGAPLRTEAMDLTYTGRSLKQASCRSDTFDHGGNGLDQDLEIEPEGPLVDVLHVQLHPLVKRN